MQVSTCRFISCQINSVLRCFPDFSAPALSPRLGPTLPPVPGGGSSLAPALLGSQGPVGGALSAFAGQPICCPQPSAGPANRSMPGMGGHRLAWWRPFLLPCRWQPSSWRLGSLLILHSVSAGPCSSPVGGHYPLLAHFRVSKFVSGAQLIGVSQIPHICVISERARPGGG